MAHQVFQPKSTLVPIICVIGWNPLAMMVLGQEYSILTAVLGSMTICVGPEYTILVMERYLEEQERTRPLPQLPFNTPSPRSIHCSREYLE